MTKKKKFDLNKILIVVTIITTISTAITGWWGIEQQNKANDLSNQSDISVQIQKQYKDKNGDLITQNTNLTLDKLNLKQSKDTVIRNLLIELASTQEKVNELQQLVSQKSNVIQLQNTTDSVKPDSDKSVKRVVKDTTTKEKNVITLPETHKNKKGFNTDPLVINK